MRHILVLIAVVAGCAPIPPADEQTLTYMAPPPLSAITTVTSPAQIVLPLDGYRLTGEPGQTVHRARRQVFEQCMFGLGFVPQPAHYTDPNATRYGIFLPESTYREEHTESTRIKSQAELDGAGDCADEADRTLEAGAPAADRSLVAALDRKATRYTEQDGRLLDAFHAWSVCMRRAGFGYATPWQAQDDRRWNDPANLDESIRTARADVACKADGNLIGIWLAVDTAYQAELVKERLADLEVVRTHNETLLANAKRTLQNT